MLTDGLECCDVFIRLSFWRHPFRTVITKKCSSLSNIKMLQIFCKRLPKEMLELMQMCLHPPPPPPPIGKFWAKGQYTSENAKLWLFSGLMQLSLLFMSGVRHRGVFHHNRRRVREQQRWIPGEVRLQQEWRGLSLRRGHRGHCLPGQLRLPIGRRAPGFDEQCSGEEVCGDGWPGLLRWDVQLVSESVIKL